MGIKRYRSLLVIVAVFAIYYVGVVVMGWSMGVMTGVYAVVLALIILIFRASLLSAYAGICYQGGKKDKAAQYLRSSIRHNPKNANTHSMLAIVLLQDGKAAEAIEIAQHAMTLNPDTDADKNLRFIIGNCHWHMGEITRAVEVVEELVKTHENLSVSVYSSLGYLHIMGGNLARAREVTEKALETASESAPLWDNMADSAYFLGILNEKRGNRGAARDFFLRARGCQITPYNTVTEEQVETKYREYYYADDDGEDSDETDV